MKAILSLSLAVILSPLAISLFTNNALADDGEERTVKVIINAHDGEAVKLDLSDLEVGETTQTTTDSGKLVTITRDDDGYLIDIEGKEIRVAKPETMGHDGDHHGDGQRHVMVKVIKSEDGEDDTQEIRIEKRVVATADGETIAISGDGGHAVKVLRIGDGDGVKVLSDIDCEDADEACIEKLLSEHGIHVEIDAEHDVQVDGESVKVIVLEKEEDTDQP